MGYALGFCIGLLVFYSILYISQSFIIFISLLAIFISCVLILFYFASEKNKDDNEESISIPGSDFLTDFVIHKRIDDLTKDKTSSDYTIYAKLVVDETGEESNVFKINNYGVKEGIIRESMKEYNDLIRTLQVKKLEDLLEGSAHES